MRIRDHVRAATAHEHVRGFADAPEDAKAYGAVCNKLPILVHTAGLTAALHFVAGRKASQRRLLAHLAQQLHDAGLLEDDSAEGLLAATRVAELAELQALTLEAQRCLLWYKRFVKSVLKIDETEEGGAEHA